MALVKYNNNSISAITSAAAIPAGAMTLIKEQTKINKKASGKQKLKDLGLDDDEIKALMGA